MLCFRVQVFYESIASCFVFTKVTVFHIVIVIEWRTYSVVRNKGNVVPFLIYIFFELYLQKHNFQQDFTHLMLFYFT